MILSCDRCNRDGTRTPDAELDKADLWHCDGCGFWLGSTEAAA